MKTESIGHSQFPDIALNREIYTGHVASVQRTQEWRCSPESDHFNKDVNHTVGTG